jgi:hypothetical protein
VIGGGFGGGEQLPQPGTSSRGQLGPIVETLMYQFQIARDDHQQIVEIMGDPTGQLADQIELLSMPERGLRLAAIGDLVGEAPVGLGELARSLGHQLFEITVDPLASCSALRIRSSAFTVATSSSGSIGSIR